MKKQHKFRAQSEYEVDCTNCGQHMTSHEAEGVCKCGTEFKIEWQAKYETSTEEPSKDLNQL